MTCGGRCGTHKRASRSGKANPRGITPTIVRSVPPTVIRLPSASRRGAEALPPESMGQDHGVAADLVRLCEKDAEHRRNPDERKETRRDSGRVHELETGRTLEWQRRPRSKVPIPSIVCGLSGPCMVRDVSRRRACSPPTSIPSRTRARAHRPYIGSGLSNTLFTTLNREVTAAIRARSLRSRRSRNRAADGACGTRGACRARARRTIHDPSRLRSEACVRSVRGPLVAAAPRHDHVSPCLRIRRRLPLGARGLPASAAAARSLRRRSGRPACRAARIHS